MSYAGQTEAVAQYGADFALTSVTRDGDSDASALDRAGVAASSEMDSYLGVNYTVPLTTVPDIVVRFCVDMLIYLASMDAGTGTDEKRKRYEDAIAWCKRISSGDAVLPVTDTTSQTESALPEVSGPDRLFSRSTMRGLL